MVEPDNARDHLSQLREYAQQEPPTSGPSLSTAQLVDFGLELIEREQGGKLFSVQDSDLPEVVNMIGGQLRAWNIQLDPVAGASNSPEHVSQINIDLYHFGSTILCFPVAMQALSPDRSRWSRLEQKLYREAFSSLREQLTLLKDLFPRIERVLSGICRKDGESDVA